MDNISYRDTIISTLQNLQYDLDTYFLVFHQLVVRRKEEGFNIRDDTSIIHPFILILMGYGPRSLLVYEIKEFLDNMSATTIYMIYNELQKLMLPRT